MMGVLQRAEIEQLKKEVEERILYSVCDITFELVTPIRVGTYKTTPIDIFAIGTEEKPYYEQYIGKSVKGIQRYVLRHLLLGTLVYAGIDLNDHKNTKYIEAVKELMVIFFGGKIPNTNKSISSIYSIHAELTKKDKENIKIITREAFEKQYLERKQKEHKMERESKTRESEKYQLIVPRLNLLMIRELNALKILNAIEKGEKIEQKDLKRLAGVLLRYSTELGLSNDHYNAYDVVQKLKYNPQLLQKLKQNLERIVYEKGALIESGRLKIKVVRPRYEVRKESLKYRLNIFKGVKIDEDAFLQLLKKVDELIPYVVVIASIMYGYGQCIRRGFASLKPIEFYIKSCEDLEKVLKVYNENISGFNIKGVKQQIEELIKGAIDKACEVLKTYCEFKGISFNCEKGKENISSLRIIPKYFVIAPEVTRIEVILMNGVQNVSQLLSKIGNATMRSAWKDRKDSECRWILGLPRGYQRQRRPSAIFLRVLNYEGNRTLVLMWGTPSLDWPKFFNDKNKISIDENKISDCFNIAFDFVKNILGGG